MPAMIRPDLRIIPEGIETQIYSREGINVSIQWTLLSRHLGTLVFEEDQSLPRKTYQTDCPMFTFAPANGQRIPWRRN
jgi:hypothetical protein